MRLAELHASGIEGILEPDAAAAYGHFLAAADMGNVTAVIEAGRRMIVGDGTGQDVEGGIAMLSTAADDGNATALLALGEMYVQGIPGALEPDASQAFDVYRRATEAGSSTARVLAGQMLLRGEGVEQDTAAGLAELERAAADGNTFGMITIGDIYKTGQDGVVAADPQVAYSYYSTAADAGSQPAKVRAGRMLLAGDGIPADIAVGMTLLEEAGQAGHSDAYHALGEYFDAAAPAGGADRARAFGYYRQAADAGSTTGTLIVAERLIAGDGVERSPADGLALLEAHAKTGNVRALILLGDIHARGDAGEVDAEAAVRAYEEAADLGESDAYMRLGDLFSAGTIVPADGERAVTYYARAAGVSMEQ
jgi:uncharacterized protein